MTAERQRQRRTRRLRLAAAVAVTAVLAVVGTATALGLITGDPQPPQAQSTRAEVSPTEAMWPVEADVPVIARVGITPTDAGTEVLLYCAYTSPPPEPTAPPTPPPDPSADPWADPSAPHAFWLVAVGADGSTEPMGSWLAGPGDELTMTGITRYTGDELARLELHGYGKVLLVLDLPG